MSSESTSKILIVYIEPAPYIVALINTLYDVWKGQIDIFFLGENLSQNWDIPLDARWKIYPDKLKDKMALFSRILFKKQYKVIHLAGWGNSQLLFLMMLSKLAGIPLTVETDTPIPYQSEWWKRIVKRLTYPALFSLVNLFLPGGTRQSKYLQYYGVDDKRIILMQMTVDIVGLQRYAKKLDVSHHEKIRELYGIKEDEVVFLFVGRLVTHKGIADLISAFNRVQNKQVILLIVGDGLLRPQIEYEADKNLRIRYAGRLTGDKLIEAYYASDVFVLPSHFEPWGLVINEAMALGCPVIVSDRVGCIDDLVINKETGLIVKSESVAELYEALEYMAHALDERTLMKENASKKIANWTLENEASKICQAWNQLIDT